MATPAAQKQSALQRYHDKLLRRLRIARANNVEEARRKINAERGATSPLGGQATPAAERR
jgi:hypothetical protein